MNHESASATENEALESRNLADAVLFGDDGYLHAENVYSIVWANEYKSSFKFLPLDFEFIGPFCQYDSLQLENFWSNLSHYQYFGAGIWPRWSPISALINTVCFLFYLALVAICFEFLRMRKKHFFQLTILDFLIGIGILAIVAGWFSNQYRRSDSITKSINIAKTSSSFPSHFHTHTSLPIWFERLTDGRFDRHARKKWTGVGGSSTPSSRLPLGYGNFRTRIYDIVDSKPVIHFVQQAKTISSIGLAAKNTETLYEVVEALDPRYLREIEIYHDIEFDVSRLANKHSLKQMELDGIKLQVSPLTEPGFTEVEWLRFWGTDPNQRITNLLHSMPKLNSFYCKKEGLYSTKTLPTHVKTLGVSFEGEIELTGCHEKFSNLTRLGIYSMSANTTKTHKLPRETGLNLKKLPNLKCLALSGFSIDSTTIERLNAMPNLEFVILTDHKSDIPVDVLKEMTPEIVILK